MNTLFILRHAKSSWAQPGIPDIERPLNGRGRKQCEMLQAWMKENAIAPKQIIASPSIRTRETASRIAGALNGAQVKFVSSIYAGNIDSYLSEIWGASEESLMLIGHNPTCDELVRHLATPRSLQATALATQGYPTGALAILDVEDSWSKLGKASANLTNFVTAKSLEAA